MELRCKPCNDRYRSKGSWRKHPTWKRSKARRKRAVCTKNKQNQCFHAFGKNQGIGRKIQCAKPVTDARENKRENCGGTKRENRQKRRNEEQHESEHEQKENSSFENYDNVSPTTPESQMKKTIFSYLLVRVMCVQALSFICFSILNFLFLQLCHF